MLIREFNILIICPVESTPLSRNPNISDFPLILNLTPLPADMRQSITEIIPWISSNFPLSRTMVALRKLALVYHFNFILDISKPPLNHRNKNCVPQSTFDISNAQKKQISKNICILTTRFLNYKHRFVCFDSIAP